jgi:hypothetical protein
MARGRRCWTGGGRGSRGRETDRSGLKFRQAAEDNAR